MKVFLYIFLFFFIIESPSFSQNRKIDSLKNILKTSGPDSNKVNTLNKLCYECYKVGNYEEEMKYANEALILAKKINWQNGIGSSYISIGAANEDLGKFNEAIEYYKKGIVVFKSIIKSGDTKQYRAAHSGLAACYNNTGLIFNYRGNYSEALKYFFDALKIREKIKDKKGASSALNNIGMVYQQQGKFDESLEKYFASLKIKEEIGNKYDLAIAYNNLGNVYASLKDYDSALEMHQKSLKLREETGDKRGVSDSYNNIGNIYLDHGNYEEALKNHLFSLKLREEIGEKGRMANTMTNIGKVHLKLNNPIESKRWVEKGLLNAKESGYKDWIQHAYFELSKADSALGNYKSAFENYKLYRMYLDSIHNEESERQSLQSSMNYEFEKKQAKIKAAQEKKDAIARTEQAKKDEINNAEKKQQQLVIAMISLGLLITVIFTIFVFRNLKTTRKQKMIIEEQKNIVEEKQKEITDSINYAKRIQYTLLAHDELLKENLNDHFVLFQPKDIVSGDFYWATSRKSGNENDRVPPSALAVAQSGTDFYLAVCDSTGHGVPGAFMSLLNISFLNEAITEKNISEPHLILNHVRERLIQNMEGGQDGMDAILIKFEIGSSKLKVKYAAANNHPVLISNGELKELPADKMPVGKGEKMDSFTLYEITVEKGDMLYLFTDGYADQFGGPKGKKFKYSNLQKIILENSNLELETQNSKLETAFNQWKGDLEQVDDVCIIGIKI